MKSKLMNLEHLESEQFPFRISTYTFDDFESIPEHSHEFTELVYVAEGAGEHIYNKQTHSISQGDVFIIDPDAEHGYSVKKNENLVVYNVLFLPKWLKSDFEALFQMSSFLDFFYVEPFLRNEARFQSHLRLDAEEQMEMEMLLKRISKECTKLKLGYQIITKTRLIEMFVFLSRCYKRENQPRSKLMDNDQKMMYFIEEFIEQRSEQPLTLEQMSEMCGLSIIAFSGKFKKLTGQTFIEYRNKIRIQKAKQLLEQTDYKILHISQEVGFEDLSFFNKLFKKLTGLSPRQYRKKFALPSDHQ